MSSQDAQATPHNAGPLVRPFVGLRPPAVRAAEFAAPSYDGLSGDEARLRAVASGSWAAGIVLYPTATDDLIAVADAGLVMQPKSTWFDPKLADGLISYPFA